MLLASALLACALAAGCRTSTLRTEPLPGAEAFPAKTAAALGKAWDARDPSQAPRTKHLHVDGTPRFTNRLLLERSPYLRQHAHNPVNWYPWGDEAFSAARRLGRPLLLSIGYSTCHWCHVMEHESFEDEEIARVLNEQYVAIKVDREERPDLDSIYMTAVQIVSGSGGWPMTVWLTPAREPFYAGTYFPARDGDRAGSRGFLTLLTEIGNLYRAKPDKVAAEAGRLSAHVRSALAELPAVAATGTAVAAADVFDAALAMSAARFDPDNGGARGGRKFPSALPLRALLRHHRRTGDAQALAIVTKTLERMAAGGIRDHLGGGFHRYSVDPAWLVPHFEKMLYDNALLATLYTEAWQVTGREDFAGVVREILAWVRREMTSPAGGFSSAIDADSRAPDGTTVEGWFYTWTPAEIAAVTGQQAAALVRDAYGVTDQGHLEGRSVLHAASDADALARRHSTTPGDVRERLATGRAQLLEARSRRPRPLVDDKILTGWNGLMISAAAAASMAFGDADALAMASRAADAVLASWTSLGGLPRNASANPGTATGVRENAGQSAASHAFLEDYAFFAAALLDLYEATGDDRRLEQAIVLDRKVEEEFEDPAGGFFRAPPARADLLVREKPVLDGAEPSGNSIAILNLLRLAEITGEARYRERADRALAALAGLFAKNPLALSDALVALDFADDAPKEIVLVTRARRESVATFRDALGAAFVPNRILVVHAGESSATKSPLAQGKIAIDGRPTAYVCENRVCDLPTNDVETFAKQIRRVRPRTPAASASPRTAGPAPQ